MGFYIFVYIFLFFVLGFGFVVAPKALLGIFGLALLVNSPVILAMLFGSEEMKDAIGKHHPPGHE